MLLLLMLLVAQVYKSIDLEKQYLCHSLLKNGSLIDSILKSRPIQIIICTLQLFQIQKLKEIWEENLARGKKIYEAPRFMSHKQPSIKLQNLINNQIQMQQMKKLYALSGKSWV
ncbi:unnamed protein product [Paramecium octaurelia]|uniref:Uncharacterized protein n=1 Tax=Paramecium octaurelia TaxID=43137 RepID=A0A8S1WJ04_PAROT|nr:unnamed protein product [Paramecium octaurelia]